jgi:O-antigen ligase
MIPAWIWSLLVVTGGCILAIWLGSYLPSLDPGEAIELVLLSAACILCAAFNNFPFLLAFGLWTPFFPHIGPIASFPAIGYAVIWMIGVLFFRLCLQGYLSYKKSFNWLLLLTFAWVPVRFMLNPVHKLGATAGGSGISGAMPYFNFCVAAGLLLFVGAILNTRPTVMYFMRCCYFVVLLSGLFMFVCAFIPATGPFLYSMGVFAAGDIGDGLLRLVQLPGYGLFLIQGALCPALFRLKRWQCVLLFVLGWAMMIIGGNRGAMAAAIMVIPLTFLLRRKINACMISLFCMVAGVAFLRTLVSSMPEQDIPSLVRSFGFLDSKIEKATGGDASAEWRYEIWADGWKKIMESPLTGKGFGNLPEHIEGNEAARSTDFETVLAGGEAHNGFVNAAYGFGLPFTIILSAMLIWFLIKESVLAFRTDKHDPEMRDLHAMLAGLFFIYPLLIYVAFDLSTAMMWAYGAVSCVISNLPRTNREEIASAGAPLRKYGEEPRPVGPYSYPYRSR